MAHKPKRSETTGLNRLIIRLHGYFLSPHLFIHCWMGCFLLLCVFVYSSPLLEWPAVRPELLWLFIRLAGITWLTSQPKMAVRCFYWSWVTCDLYFALQISEFKLRIILNRYVQYVLKRGTFNLVSSACLLSTTGDFSESSWTAGQFGAHPPRHW